MGLFKPLILNLSKLLESGLVEESERVKNTNKTTTITLHVTFKSTSLSINSTIFHKRQMTSLTDFVVDFSYRQNEQQISYFSLSAKKDVFGILTTLLNGVTCHYYCHFRI